MYSVRSFGYASAVPAADDAGSELEDESIVEEDIPDAFTSDDDDAFKAAPVPPKSSAAPSVAASSKSAVTVATTKAAAVTYKYKVGDLVDAQYGRDVTWYPGRIQECNADGTYLVRYDDNDSEDGVLERHIRARVAVPVPAPTVVKTVAPTPRSAVSELESVAEDEAYSVDSFDAESSMMTASAAGKTGKAATAAPVAPKVLHRFKVGDVIDAQYGRDVTWYPGRIQECNADGTYLVRYDDNDSEDGVLERHIRARVAVPVPAPPATPATVPTSAPSTTSLSSGTTVTAAAVSALTVPVSVSASAAAPAPVVVSHGLPRAAAHSVAVGMPQPHAVTTQTGPTGHLTVATSAGSGSGVHKGESVVEDEGYSVDEFEAESVSSRRPLSIGKSSVVIAPSPLGPSLQPRVTATDGRSVHFGGMVIHFKTSCVPVSISSVTRRPACMW